MDGTYVMTISWPKTKSTNPAARCVGGPEGSSPLAVYELTLKNGTVQLAVRIGGLKAPLEPAYSGSFRVERNQFIFGDGGNPLTAKFTVNADALTLKDLQGGQCGDIAIWTTKPWTRR